MPDDLLRMPRDGDVSTGAAPRRALSLPWLAAWRWWAVAGQLLTVVIVSVGFGVALPIGRVLALIALTAATNVVLAYAVRGGIVLPHWLSAAILSLDTVVLTGLLAITGGASNPFSILYLVHIALGAVVLGRGWTWALVGLAVGCYGALFFVTDPAGMHVHGSGFDLHLQGMWIAFTAAAVLTAYFVVSLADAVDRRDAEIAAIREQAARNERLASLTTLAAGAAHALGSPLGTIAVVAKELERATGKLSNGAAGLTDDARLIRAEVERCRRILDQMVADSGETTGEAPVIVTARDILSDVMGELATSEVGRVQISPSSGSPSILAPRRALAQAVANLVRNGLDASAPAGTVSLDVDASVGAVRLVVRDQGSGMTPDVLARAIEPFFTTKPPGRGLGLGLFLAKSLAEGLGGRLVVSSALRAGTTAIIELPRSADPEIRVEVG